MIIAPECHWRAGTVEAQQHCALPGQLLPFNDRWTLVNRSYLLLQQDILDML